MLSVGGDEDGCGTFIAVLSKQLMTSKVLEIPNNPLAASG
jgi:hypothetical protein